MVREIMWPVLAIIGAAVTPTQSGAPPASTAERKTNASERVPTVAVPRASKTPFNEFRGRVIASQVFIAPELGSDADSLHVLQTFATNSFSQSCGFWRIHLIAFLEQPADSQSVLLVIDDLSPADAAQPTRQLELKVRPGAQIVRVNNLVISDDLGYQRGHSYALLIMRRSTGNDAEQRGKGDVIARGVITLW